MASNSSRHNNDTTTITGWVHNLKNDVNGMLDQFRSEQATTASADATARAKFVHGVAKHVDELRGDVTRFMADLSDQRTDTAAAQAKELDTFCRGLHRWVADLHKVCTHDRKVVRKAQAASRKVAARDRAEFADDLSKWSTEFKADVAKFEKTLHRQRAAINKADTDTRDRFITELKSDVGSMINGFARERANMRRDVLGIGSKVASYTPRNVRPAAKTTPPPKAASANIAGPSPDADENGKARSSAYQQGVDYRAELRRRAADQDRANRRKAS